MEKIKNVSLFFIFNFGLFISSPRIVNADSTISIEQPFLKSKRELNFLMVKKAKEQLEKLFKKEEKSLFSKKKEDKKIFQNVKEFIQLNPIF